jgi:division protein CdvB (Snf7/Vps24/ESCRT-III family)
MTTTLTKSEITDKIRSSALLVSLQLGSYNPVKTDNSESRKVCDSHGIDTNSRVMKVQKNTLPTAGVLKDIEKLDNRIRQLVDQYTAPFARGIGLLPAVKFFDLRNAVNLLFDERDALIKKLADEYSLYLDEAKRELNGAFKSEDYPPVKSVISRFYHKMDTMQIADPKSSKLNVLGEIAESIQAAASDTLNEKLESVTPFLFDLLLKPLTHQSSVLQNPDHKLSQTTFTNVLDAATQAEGLNLLDNDQIRNAVYEIGACLNYDKDAVKDDGHLRKQVLTDCNRIIQALGGEIPAPAVHKPRAGKKSKSEDAEQFSETAPSQAPEPEAILVADLETADPEPTDEQIHATADAADETFNPDAVLAKLGW